MLQLAARLRRYALLSALLTLPACEPYGGDTESGLSALDVLAGRGTWQEPAARPGAPSTAGPASSLVVQGGAASGGSGKTLTLLLHLLPLDDTGLPALDSLTTDAFAIDPARITFRRPEGQAAASLVAMEASVIEVAVKPPADVPPTGMLLFDSSGSTRWTDRDRRRVEAAQAFLDAMPEGTQVAVLDFGVTGGGILGPAVVSEGLEASRMLHDFSADRESLRGAVARVTSAGGTPLYAALRDTMAVMEAIARRAAGPRFVVVFSDGAAGDYDAADEDRTVARALAIETPIHTVALAPADATDDVHIRQLHQLSLRTKGLAMTAQDPDELVEHFAQLSGALDARVTLLVELVLNAMPEPGAWEVQGEVELAGAQGTLRAPWSLVVAGPGL